MAQKIQGENSVLKDRVEIHISNVVVVVQKDGTVHGMFPSLPIHEFLVNQAKILLESFVSVYWSRGLGAPESPKSGIIDCLGGSSQGTAENSRSIDGNS